jgi:hypothetical protein
MLYRQQCAVKMYKELVDEVGKDVFENQLRRWDVDNPKALRNGHSLKAGNVARHIDHAVGAGLDAVGAVSISSGDDR